MGAAISKDLVRISGSSGLIASATITRLADGHLLIGFDREGPSYAPRAAECVCVNPPSDESVREEAHGRCVMLGWCRMSARQV